MTEKRSPVWKFFVKVGIETSKCIVCSVLMSTKKGGSTTPMINHLKLHNIFIVNGNVVISEANGEMIKFQRTGINNFLTVKKETLNEIISKFAAIDGISFRTILSSERIKNYIKSKNYNHPKSGNTVRKLIHETFIEKVKLMQHEIKNITESGGRFSCDIDEWTDILMRRYLNISIHSNNKSFHLNLVPIFGSATATNIGILLGKTLSAFELTLEKNIVVLTSDGASVMTKLGKEIKCEQQLCYNHAIHNAVIDVFYKSNDLYPHVISREESTLEESETENEEADDEHIDGLNIYKRFADDQNLGLKINYSDVDSYYLCPSFEESINEVRRIVKFFRKSAIRTECLQAKVKSMFGKTLTLILDIRTRWNSLIPMVKRFLQIKVCINSALDEFSQFNISENHISGLEEIVTVLEPLELAVNEISKNEANLLTAEVR